ncbi:MAG: hypothetical protein J6A15_01560 [Clostridia bacterium]|nr:hypothetical protein [Clostridia bacterium]
MSNLGLYQKITTWAKKVGGPAYLILIIAFIGYIIGKGIEFLIKIIRKCSTKNIIYSKIYVVHSYGKSNEELDFNIGDKYRVLERDKDSVLIEKIGNTNNPYFVSAELLRSISDFV